MPTSLLALAIVLLVALIVGLSMALAQNIADNRRGTAGPAVTPRTRSAAATPSARSHR